MFLKHGLPILIAWSMLVQWCQNTKDDLACSLQTKKNIKTLNSLSINASVLWDTLKTITEEDIINLLRCSSTKPMGDSTRIHAVVLQNIADMYSAQTVKQRPKDIRIYLAYMNMFPLEELDLDNEDMPQISIYEKARFTNIKPLALDIDEKNLEKIAHKMLVICANESEVYQFRHNISAHTIFDNTDDTHKNYGFRYAQIWTKKYIDVIQRNKVDELPKEKYGIIQIKGHTGDMNILEALKSYIEKNATIIILGWCNAEYFTEKVLRENGLPFTNISIGEGAHNDYVALELFNRLNKSNKNLQIIVTDLEKDSKISMKKINTPFDDITMKINALVHKQ